MPKMEKSSMEQPDNTSHILHETEQKLHPEHAAALSPV
jgi:hypothetical protein